MFHWSIFQLFPHHPAGPDGDSGEAVARDGAEPEPARGEGPAEGGGTAPPTGEREHAARTSLTESLDEQPTSYSGMWNLDF